VRERRVLEVTDGEDRVRFRLVEDATPLHDLPERVAFVLPEAPPTHVIEKLHACRWRSLHDVPDLRAMHPRRRKPHPGFAACRVAWERTQSPANLALKSLRLGPRREYETGTAPERTLVLAWRREDEEVVVEVSVDPAAAGQPCSETFTLERAHGLGAEVLATLHGARLERHALPWGASMSEVELPPAREASVADVEALGIATGRAALEVAELAARDGSLVDLDLEATAGALEHALSGPSLSGELGTGPAPSATSPPPSEMDAASGKRADARRLRLAHAARSLARVRAVIAAGLLGASLAPIARRAVLTGDALDVEATRAKLLGSRSYFREQAATTHFWGEPGDDWPREVERTLAELEAALSALAR